MRGKSKNKRITFGGFFKSIAFFAHLVIIVMFLLAAFSDRFDPRSYMIMSYLGLAFPFFLFANLMFILLWLFIWRWKYFTVGFISLLIAWQSIITFVPYSFSHKEIPRNAVKVLTYNVMAFAYKPHTPKKPNQIIEFIKKQDADIVCLQECQGLASKISEDAFLKKSFPKYSYVKFIDRPNSHNYVPTGLAVLSKFPIKSTRLVDYESDNNCSAVFRLDYKGKELVLINNHLESFKLTMEDRANYEGVIKSFSSEKLDSLKGTVMNKLGPAFRLRAAQADAVADEIKKGGEYIIVCGDFNDTPISYATRTIRGNLRDVFKETGRGVGVSYNRNLFLFRIDHFFCSSRITPYACTVHKVNYSDHYPLSAYFLIE